jgi:hypothetical protein
MNNNLIQYSLLSRLIINENEFQFQGSELIIDEERTDVSKS